MSSTLRLSVILPPNGDYLGGAVSGFVEIAQAAERAGIDGVVVSDHVVMGPRVDRYPWGDFPGRPDDAWPEPLTLLTAIAATTTTLQLGTGVIIAPLRPATLLAKTAATIDRLSNGRLDLGVGTGWQQEEFDAQGLDFERRGRLLTDTMAACRALWQPGPVAFSSPSCSFSDVWCEPQPVRPGGPTVLFSGSLTPRNVRRIVELGDGWIPIMTETFDGVVAGVARLRDELTAAGRDPAELRVRARLGLLGPTGDPPNVPMAQVDDFVAAGISDLYTSVPPALPGVAAASAWLDELGHDWAVAREKVQQ